MVVVNSKQTRPMIVAITAICFLTIPGLLYNNLNASGLEVAQVLVCNQPGAYLDTCQGQVPTGCQAQPAQCTLNGSSFSLLNQASPFTQLFQGNIFGFFTGLSNPQQGIQGGRGPFDNLGQVFSTVNCQVTKGADGHQTNALIGHCTQTNPDNSNVTEGNAFEWPNWNNGQSGVSRNLDFYNLGNATYPMTCSWETQINYTTLANGPGWTYFGCDVSFGSHVITNPIWSILVAMPVDIGGVATGTNHEYLYAQTENADFDTLPSQNNPFLSTKFENWFQTFKGVLISGSSFSSQYFLPGLNGPVMGFIFGFVLLIIGLGLNFDLNGTFLGTGGGFGAGVNQQGTRLAQILGIGLLVWSPLYSEFSAWFTSGFLPNGIDGSLGIVGLVLDGMFFFGIIWTAMSWT